MKRSRTTFIAIFIILSAFCHSCTHADGARSYNDGYSDGYNDGYMQAKKTSSLIQLERCLQQGIISAEQYTELISCADSLQ